MTSACEHGRNAAQRGKHIQACPFDSGSPDWREWRNGFCDATVTSSRGLDVICTELDTNRVTSIIPMGRMDQPDEIADAALFPGTAQNLMHLAID